jgi:hypothetical protein
MTAEIAICASVVILIAVAMIVYDIHRNTRGD